MAVSSLPSNYGIGTLGKAAYDYVDFLKEAKVKYWQMLPLGPTSYGDSPYSSFSSFAGNPYFVDLDILIQDGLLTKEEVESFDFGKDPRYVDYLKLFNSRFIILNKAKERGYEKDKKKVEAFRKRNAWLDDYALFMALKDYFKGKEWIKWPEDIKKRDPKALERYKEKLKDRIELYTYIQFLFFKQWKDLKKYINDSGIKVIGDIPIYAALDSCDVWANTKVFQLDKDTLKPKEVSGCPPDRYSEDGQLWGNPLYDWKYLKRTKYDWWLKRIEGNSKLFDVVRIDHFRGLYSYYSIKYGRKNARVGHWVLGPGMDFLDTVNKTFKNVEFIAEDLGYLEQGVLDILKGSGWPGMRIMQFAFTSDEKNRDLPHNYVVNSICYTGTHDNHTLLGWKKTAYKGEIDRAKEYFDIGIFDDFNFKIIEGGMRSVSKLFVAQMQDYLKLGLDHRMNLPGTLGLNWKWRMLSSDIKPELKDKIKELAVKYNRA